MKIPKGVDFVEVLFTLEGKTEWVIDVWNCHGVLKKREWGVGYGSLPKLPKEYRWVNIGYFTIPIKKGIVLSEKQKELISKVLFEIINRNGAINISGFYLVFSTDMDRLIKAFREELQPAKTSEIVEKLLETLKKNTNQALHVWSSAWSYRCWDGCEGYHLDEYVLYSGQEFIIIEQGAHHAWSPSMWDISPTKISEDEVKAKLEKFVEKIREDEDIYEGEEFVETLNLTEIKQCEKHGYYFDYGYGCKKC